MVGAPVTALRRDVEGSVPAAAAEAPGAARPVRAARRASRAGVVVPKAAAGTATAAELLVTVAAAGTALVADKPARAARSPPRAGVAVAAGVVLWTAVEEFDAVAAPALAGLAGTGRKGPSPVMRRLKRPVVGLGAAVPLPAVVEGAVAVGERAEAVSRTAALPVLAVPSLHGGTREQDMAVSGKIHKSEAHTTSAQGVLWTSSRYSCADAVVSLT